MQRNVCSTLYYKDEKKIAVISSFAISGISPRLVEGIAQKRSKNVATYEVVEFIHDILRGLSAVYKSQRPIVKVIFPSHLNFGHGTMENFKNLFTEY